jgi:hypothetical protein
MGLLKKDQGQLFYEFHLGDAVLKIIRYGRLTPLSTCLGFARTCSSLFVDGSPV